MKIYLKFYFLCVNFREQRPPAFLHREGGQGDVAPPKPHLLQPPRPPALQELRTAGREAHLRHRRDGRFRARIELELTFKKSLPEEL